jgi:chorismate mutase
MLKLNRYRQQIDNIDENVLKLISKRIFFIKKIAKFKDDNKLKIISWEREKTILEQIGKLSIKLKLNKKFVSKLFKLILTESKRIQKQIK